MTQHAIRFVLLSCLILSQNNLNRGFGSLAIGKPVFYGRNASFYTIELQKEYLFENGGLKKTKGIAFGYYFFNKGVENQNLGQEKVSGIFLYSTRKYIINRYNSAISVLNLSGGLMSIKRTEGGKEAYCDSVFCIDSKLSLPLNIGLRYYRLNSKNIGIYGGFTLSHYFEPFSKSLPVNNTLKIQVGVFGK